MGTSDPCGAWARARTAHEACQNTIAGLGWNCAIDGHKLVVDGTCAVCTYRARPTLRKCASQHAQGVGKESRAARREQSSAERRRSGDDQREHQENERDVVDDDDVDGVQVVERHLRYRRDVDAEPVTEVDTRDRLD